MWMHVNTTLQAFAIKNGRFIVNGLLRDPFKMKEHENKYKQNASFPLHRSKLPKTNDIRSMDSITKLTCKVTYYGNLRTEIEHIDSGAKAQTDAPVDNHGMGRSLSPTDMTCASLASCMFTVMGIKAKSMNLNLDGSHADVTKVMADAPRRIKEIKVKIFLSEKLSEADRKVLEATALNCPVAKSLHPDIHQDVRFEYLALAQIST